MPLYIRDDEVAELARKVKELTKQRTITDAVRRSLQHEIERVRQSTTLDEQIGKALALADAMGPTDQDFDMKTFTDEMWGET